MQTTDYLNTHKDRFLQELFDFLRIPSISADPAFTGDVAKAAEFGREAFRILETIAQDKDLAATLHKIDRRAHASAFRVDARYLLDGGMPAQALRAWFRALFIYPPVALKRMNIFVSSVLSLFGLGKLREAVLQRRKKDLSG